MICVTDTGVTAADGARVSGQSGNNPETNKEINSQWMQN